MKIKLETQRLVLRPFENDDYIKMFDNWASDDEVTKYLTWNTHKSMEESKNIVSIWLEQYSKEERINFAIELKENNELIGGIDVCGYIDGIPVIGYVLSRKYWNQGLMTEAFKEVIKLLFSLGYKKIRVDAMIENIGSNKVIQKCGGIYIKTVEEYISSKDKNVKINQYIIKNNNTNL